MRCLLFLELQFCTDAAASSQRLTYETTGSVLICQQLENLLLSVTQRRQDYGRLWLGKLPSIIAVASTPPSGTPVHKGLELQDKRLDIQLYHRTLKQVNRKTQRNALVHNSSNACELFQQGKPITKDAPAKDSPVLVGSANSHSRLERRMLPPKEVVGGCILVDAQERG